METIGERVNKINNKEEIENIIQKITFAPSCLDFKWKFEVRELPKGYGYQMRVTFNRPDTNTGDPGRGKGRWMQIPHLIEDSIIKTGYVCMELIVKHELMEAFLYENRRIFNPHKSLEEL